MSEGPSIKRRVIQSFLAASVGAALGYLYARTQLPPKLLQSNGAMTGMFATAGAAVGMLTLRMSKMLWTMFSDYGLGRDE